MKPDRATLVAFFLAAALGSFNFVAVRYSNKDLAPFWGAGFRFAAACLLFFLVAAVRRARVERGRAFAGAVLFGLVGFGLSYAFIYWGMQEVRAGTAAVLMALVPLATFFLAVTQGIERFRWRGLMGGLLALGGIALLQQPESGAASLWRVLAVLGSVLCAAQSSVIVKRFPRMDAFAFNGVATGVGAIVLLVISGVAQEERAWPAMGPTVVAVAYLIVGGTLGLFALHLFVLHRWTASGASYGFVVTPILSMPLAVWLDDQVFSGRFLVAALLVLAGVYVGALARARAPSAPTAVAVPLER